ncbi:MAG TPA: hypothetical protein VFT72_01765 [Opitutaceae bacterium]|nr:hypothetical protein [Opitutaceae bacterium]
MLSLAPIRYRTVFAEHGGPVAQVQAGKFSVFDAERYQALAFLKPELAENKPQNILYGAADGSGSSSNPSVAQHIAISEALERWAFLETHRSGGNKYGFNVDHCSNGMAAFPGFRWQARRRAKFEALERFAVIGWWDKRLNATVHRSPYPGVGLVRIEHLQNKGEVVILYHKAANGAVAYAHAAGSSLASATAKAAVELVRTELVIARHRACGALAPVTDYFERRCLHFASPEGHAEFLERLHSRTEKPAPRWNVIFDGEIPGPWSQWATVWRHCVEMPTYAFLDRKQNFFFW